MLMLVLSMGLFPFGFLFSNVYSSSRFRLILYLPNYFILRGFKGGFFSFECAEDT